MPTEDPAKISRNQHSQSYATRYDSFQPPASSSRVRRTAGQPPGKQVSRMAARCSWTANGFELEYVPMRVPVALEPGVGGHDVEIRTRGGGHRDRRRPLRVVEVVGIEDRDEVSGRSTERMVERRSAAAVRLAEKDDLVVERFEALPAHRSIRRRRRSPRAPAVVWPSAEATARATVGCGVEARDEDRDARSRPGDQSSRRVRSQQWVSASRAGRQDA